jgi:hypothetical protein
VYLIVCDLEISTTGQPRPDLGCGAKQNNFVSKPATSYYFDVGLSEHVESYAPLGIAVCSALLLCLGRRFHKHSIDLTLWAVNTVFGWHR